MEYQITNAEWKVMKILWTKKESTSSEMFDLLNEKYDWSRSTVKTLLARLVEKDVLSTKRMGKSFIYSPSISEDQGVVEVSEDVEDKICSKKIPLVIGELIRNNQLTDKDIDKLQQILTDKRKEAVEDIACNCVPGQCNC